MDHAINTPVLLTAAALLAPLAIYAARRARSLRRR